MHLWIMWISRRGCYIIGNIPVNKFLIIILISGIPLFVLPSYIFDFTYAADESTKARVESNPIFILLIDGLSFSRLDHWITESPSFARWVSQSYIGGMSMRTAGSRNVQNQMATVVTGVKSRGSSALLTSLQFDRETNEIYVPYLVSWSQKEWEREQSLLGEELKKGGITREVIGNGDLGNEIRRIAPLLLTDREGIVPKGKIDLTLLREAMERPYGVRTDYNQLKEDLIEADGDVIAIEIGDLRRLFSTWNNLGQIQREQVLHEVEQEIIDFILWLSKLAESDHRELWLISPGIDPISQQKNEWLTPMIRHIVDQPNYNYTEHRASSLGGLLTSPTTRQLGIVANVDFMPTILSHFGLEIPLIEGRTMGIKKGIEEQKWFLNEVKKILHIHTIRPSLLYQVILIQVLFLIGTLVMTYLVPKSKKWWATIGRFLLIYVLLVPLLLLLLGGFAPLWTNFYIHLYLFIIVTLFGVITLRFKVAALYRLISLLYVILIVADGLMGNPMMKRSFLGYDPIIGARFYGIGNEYMGVLVGSSLLFAFLFFGDRVEERSWKKWGALLFAIVILAYLGLPGGGTNAGGTISWFVALILISKFYFPSQWRGRGIFVMAIGILALFVLFLSVQYFQGIGEQTHIGQFLHQFTIGGEGAIWETIRRKWEMNIRLIKVSNYSKLFVTSLLLLGWFLLLRPLKRSRKKRNHNWEETIWVKAFTTIVWVSLVNLFVNDSGVVAAAMNLLFAVVPLLHLVMVGRFGVAEVRL